jgi:hypothetical protein
VPVQACRRQRCRTIEAGHDRPHKKPPSESYDSWLDRLIREAQERGDFENLPGAGRPIPGLDKPDDENGWIKQKLEQEKFPAAPEPLRLRAEADRLIEELAGLESETLVREQVRRINERLRRANALPSPLPPRPLLDEQRELERRQQQPPA